MATQVDDERDAGFTMLEVVVGMVILSIFLVIFGGSMVSVFRSVNRTQQTANARSQVNQLFVKLDSQLRYASAIGQPQSNVYATGDAVVRFATEYSGTATCVELRLTSSGVFQRRSFDRDASPITMGPVSVLATGIFADTPRGASDSTALTAGPFSMFGAVGNSNNQRLEIAINATSPGSENRVRHSDVTYTALNTGTATTNTQSVCSQAKGFSWPAT